MGMPQTWKMSCNPNYVMIKKHFDGFTKTSQNHQERLSDFKDQYVLSFASVECQKRADNTPSAVQHPADN